MAVAIPRLPSSISSSSDTSMASWYTQRRSMSSSNHLTHPVWQQQSASAHSSSWSQSVPVQYGGSDYLVEANEYASSSEDFNLEQYVAASPSSVGNGRAPTPVLYSLPDTFDPRGSQAQETAVEAGPSASDAFVFDSANAATSSSIGQWSSCSQVPLRATQASPEMRAMMNVFRIDPFAFHNGPPPPSAAGPLVTPGKVFEWQLPSESPEERGPEKVADAIQSVPHDLNSEMGDPAYGFPLSAVTSVRRVAVSAQRYDSPSYSNSSASYPPSQTPYLSLSPRFDYERALPEPTRDVHASWSTYPTRMIMGSSVGNSRPGTSGTGYSEPYQDVHDAMPSHAHPTTDMASARYAPVQRHSYDEPQTPYYHGHGSGSY